MKLKPFVSYVIICLAIGTTVSDRAFAQGRLKPYTMGKRPIRPEPTPAPRSVDSAPTPSDGLLTALPEACNYLAVTKPDTKVSTVPPDLAAIVSQLAKKATTDAFDDVYERFGIDLSAAGDTSVPWTIGACAVFWGTGQVNSRMATVSTAIVSSWKSTSR